jgi:hypothetical protein
MSRGNSVLLNDGHAQGAETSSLDGHHFPLHPAFKNKRRVIVKPFAVKKMFGS